MKWNYSNNNLLFTPFMIMFYQQSTFRWNWATSFALFIYFDVELITSSNEYIFFIVISIFCVLWSENTLSIIFINIVIWRILFCSFHTTTFQYNIQNVNSEAVYYSHETNTYTQTKCCFNIDREVWWWQIYFCVYFIFFSFQVWELRIKHYGCCWFFFFCSSWLLLFT